MYQPELFAIIPPLKPTSPAQLAAKPVKPSRRRHAVMRKAQAFAEMMEAAATYIAVERPKIRTAADTADLLRPMLAGKPQEELWVLLLDSRNGLIAMHPCTIGLVDRSQSHAREVFRDAIQQGCSRLLLAHNHPSGDPIPSPQDVESTRGLASVGRLIGIEVLDHVIIGARTPTRERDYASLRELGLM